MTAPMPAATPHPHSRVPARERDERDRRDHDRRGHDHDRDAGAQRSGEHDDRGRDGSHLTQDGTIERAGEEEQHGDDHRGDRREHRRIDRRTVAREGGRLPEASTWTIANAARTALETTSTTTQQGGDDGRGDPCGDDRGVAPLPSIEPHGDGDGDHRGEELVVDRQVALERPSASRARRRPRRRRRLRWRRARARPAADRPVAGAQQHGVGDAEHDDEPGGHELHEHRLEADGEHHRCPRAVRPCRSPPAPCVQARNPMRIGRKTTAREGRARARPPRCRGSRRRSPRSSRAGRARR